MNDFTRFGPYLNMMQQMPGETAVDIRPVRPSDVQAILEMHERLSTDSLFLRYLVPYVPANLPDHVREICSRPADQGAALVATVGSRVVGFGYYVIKPDQPDTALLSQEDVDDLLAAGFEVHLLRRRPVRALDPALVMDEERSLADLEARARQDLGREDG